MSDDDMIPEDSVVYALRKDGETMTLVEVERGGQLGSLTRVSARTARGWVLAGQPHETGLWVDVVHDGHRKQRVVRYAEPSDQ